MDFDLPDEIEQLRRTVRKFVDEAVIPVEHVVDRDNAVPDSILREAARLGLFGIAIPEEYGGSALGALARCVVHKELARGGLGSICSIIGAHTGIGTIGIVRTGSRFVKEKYLPALVTGDAIAAYAITEPNTGSDVAGVETRAERRGDRFLFTRGKPTERIWYYDLSDIKTGKKSPLTLAHFEEFFRLLPARGDSDHSWTVERKEIEARGYDLKAVNPNAKRDEDTRTPEELLDIIEAKGREVAEALAALRAVTGKKG